MRASWPPQQGFVGTAGGPFAGSRARWTVRLWRRGAHGQRFTGSGVSATGRRHDVALRLPGGACGCLRLQCRRPRIAAQAARFARARPGGRPAGALRPRRGAGRRLVSHTTRPERAKEDPMNRWTGTGHLTKDPKLLETDGGTAICTLRVAVKRAGKQGKDGYF